MNITHFPGYSRFQSTLPVRGATTMNSKEQAAAFISIHAPRAGSDASANPFLQVATDFNPRSPCGERQFFLKQCAKACVISIHAPRAGSDRHAYNVRFGRCNFNPRSPCGERQENAPIGRGKRPISIHAPRAGSDSTFTRWSECGNISIHAPRAGSDESRTAPAIGAELISIHAPRAGSDVNNERIIILFRNFNPRSPCGERRVPGGICA